MHITDYIFVCLTSDIFGTYVLFKLMKIFYEHREYNKKIEFASYVFYFIYITFMRLLLSDSILSHIAVLVFIPLLTLNYFRASKILIRTLATVFSIYLPIEIIVYFGIRAFDFAGADIILTVGTKMLAFIVLIVVKKKIDRDDVPPLLFWLMIFVPIGVSFLFFMMIISNPSSSAVSIAGSSALYLISFCVFVLYQNLATYFNDKFYEKLYKSELEESSRLKHIVYDYQDEAKRHQRELKQHIHLLTSFLENEDSIVALQYCKSKFDLKNRLFEDAYTGNDEIDRILNYELLRTKMYGIKVKLETILPKKLDDELVNDLHIILKNLIENAISEFLKTKEDNKKIRISMGYKKNMIYLSVANSYSAEKIYENGEYAPTREDEKNPASGLIRASEILKKYNTNMVVMNMDTSFVVAMVIPVPYDLE